jgi:hypothetical protein
MSSHHTHTHTHTNSPAPPSCRLWSLPASIVPTAAQRLSRARPTSHVPRTIAVPRHARLPIRRCTLRRTAPSALPRPHAWRRSLLRRSSSCAGDGLHVPSRGPWLSAASGLGRQHPGHAAQPHVSSLPDLQGEVRAPLRDRDRARPKLG